MHDIIIIGGGPAGLTAAVYGLRNGKSVLVIEKSVFGGQITNSPKVENIPGFESISGDEFADKFLDQAMNQGADVMLDEALSAEQTADGVKVTLASGDTVEGRTLILATGTKHRLLGLPGEEDLVGDGISFCAVCDGDFYRDKTVVMIGGGNSAFVEANLLVEIVDKLIMLQDLPFFTAEQKMQDQLFSHNNVETHVSTKILAYEVEDGQLKGVRYEEGGEEKVAACDGVFLAVGLIPDNKPFVNLAEVDKPGYFIAGEGCATTHPNIFVAGDCRTKTLRQVATACADGAIAAISACNYINDQK
ncbi:MAG: FAD-dependent oxidoreductase [Lachnospiraceae bacterium]|nr:FAD-dependent oxidoreductase [Lachnospiraceae bacterium]